MKDLWGAMLRQAVIGWGLTPQDFWGLSWREWVLLTQTDAPLRLEAAGLKAMMAQFPDEAE
ncbi:MAG: phage tail assembly chaperone [Asticcacaulis sp.]